jgi:hypothetical protein
MSIRHPIRGQPTLKWELRNSVYTAIRVQMARYTHGKPYEVREPFATVRRYQEGVWVDHTQDTKWVVTRNSFDELRGFPLLASAKTYVESIFAMEIE